MAYIHAHKKGWRAQVAKRGIRRSAVFPTKSEAKAWASRLETEIDAGQHDARPESPTFGWAVREYQAKVSAKKEGRVWEIRRLDAMLDHFGDVPLTAIDAPQIAGWRDERLKTVAGSTVVREANTLRNLFKIAKNEWKVIQHEPFLGVKLPKENAPRRAIWPWQLIKRVLRAPRTGKTAEMQAAFHIALRTGMRLQEALAAPTGFDAKRQVVVVKSKTEAQAQIPVGRIAAKLLKRPPFTVGPNEGSVLFSKLCRQLLIEGLTFHDARATALTHLARKTNVFRLSKVSRHKDMNLLLSTYYRETPEQIARTI